MNFDVVIFIETAVNGFVFDDFVVRYDDNLPGYYCVELPSTSGELDLRYSPIVILVEFRKLRGVLGCQRQCRLYAIRAFSD